MVIKSDQSYEFTSDTLQLLLDYSSDEIFIFNKEQEIIYVNSACERNYGVTKEELIGKSNMDLIKENFWSPTAFPEVFKEKHPVYMSQTTITGRELLTAAIPILDDHNEVELVITTAREMKHYYLHQNKNTEKLPHTTPDNMIYESESFEKVIDFAQKVGKADCNVLIHGESGTGKGLIAKYIHDASIRNNHNFLTINCGALPEQLLESELFGYEKGAFTGASSQGKEGLLSTADDGTVFLDEIGEISLAFQVKLLHVLQDKEFIPIGSNKKKKVNVRFIAATNRNLEKLVEEGKFREDLYYRLNVVDLEMPPLRERGKDIEPLLYHFLEKFNAKYDAYKVISDQCLQVLLNYSWPGNVRQLENLVEKLVIVSDDIIEITDLPKNFLKSDRSKVEIESSSGLNETLNETRKYLVRKSYKKYRNSRKVAVDLKTSQTTASRLIREYCADLVN